MAVVAFVKQNLTQLLDEEHIAALPQEIREMKEKERQAGALLISLAHFHSLALKPLHRAIFRPW